MGSDRSKYKTSLMQKLRIYKPFAVSELQGALAYKWSFYLFLLSSLLTVVVQYYLWKAIYGSSSSTVINGFTFNDMIIYIIMSYITGNIVSVSAAREIGFDVVEGSIAMNLIKPINYRIRLLFSSIGGMLFHIIVPSSIVWIALLAVRFVSLGELPSVLSVGGYLLSALFSFFLMFFFDFCFGMLAFYTTYIWGMNMAKQAVLSFLTGSMIPLAFFPGAVQKIFDFLPFSSMNYTPVMIYLGKLSGSAMWLALGKQLLWIGILYLLSDVLWKHAMKRLTVLGG